MGLLHYGHGSQAHFSKGTIVPLSSAKMNTVSMIFYYHPLSTFQVWKRMENIGKSWKHIGYRFIPDVSANMAACGCLLLDITPRFLPHKVAFGARGRHGSRSGAARVGDDTTWRSAPMRVPNSHVGRSVRMIPLHTMTELLILARNSNSLHMQKLKPTQFPGYCMKKRKARRYWLLLTTSCVPLWKSYLFLFIFLLHVPSPSTIPKSAQNPC